MIKNCFTNDYEAKKLLQEIQFMRQLSAMKQNCFTPYLFDVITPKDMDSKTTDKLPFVFLVMQLE